MVAAEPAQSFDTADEYAATNSTVTNESMDRDPGSGAKVRSFLLFDCMTLRLRFIRILGPLANLFPWTALLLQASWLLMLSMILQWVFLFPAHIG